MLLDVNTVLGSRDSSSQISFNAQIARSPCRYVHLGVQVLYRHWVSSGSFCNAEFASRRAADCHCRHPASCGTACADPSNMQSLSLTARSDPSVGTQNPSGPGRHISQDNDDPFPSESQETVSALVWCHAMARGGWRRWQHDQIFLLDFFADTVLHRSVRWYVC